jgi:ubiquinone biosynthesis O-methyltransferase
MRKECNPLSAVDLFQKPISCQKVFESFGGVVNMKFTGECFIPGKSPKRIEDDHIERYKFATKFVNGKKVLDIACGVGYGSRILAEAGASRVEGVDISEDVIHYAKYNYQMHKISFQKGDISNYKNDNIYDVIVCFETIEHVLDFRKALSNLYSLLKNSGLLLISSPNRLITSPLTASMNDRPSNEFHIREFTIKELESLLKEHGFTVEGADVFGQRQQRYFCNRYLRKTYKKLFNPDACFSPALTRVEKLAPRYFVIVARKVNKQNFTKPVIEKK